MSSMQNLFNKLKIEPDDANPVNVFGATYYHSYKT